MGTSIYKNTNVQSFAGTHAKTLRREEFQENTEDLTTNTDNQCISKKYLNKS